MWLNDGELYLAYRQHFYMRKNAQCENHVSYIKQHVQKKKNWTLDMTNDFCQR